MAPKAKKAAAPDVDYSVLETGMRLQVEFEGTYYSAEVVTVSKAKNRKKAPVKVHFIGHPVENDDWVGEDRIRSKLLKGGAPKEKAEPKAKAKAKAKAEKADKPTDGIKTGKDGGSNVLGKLRSYKTCVLAEYIWLDAAGVPRAKTKTITARPTKVSDLPIWNYDGSSTEQAEGHNSEINLKPRCLFDDPFRGYPHVMVVADCWNAWNDEPAIGNSRAACAEVHEKYKSLDAWYGIEQEYTLMKPAKIGVMGKIPFGFNADGSEPAPQGPYYTGVGFNLAVGRPVADEHLIKCLQAGVKIAGINAEVMPGQWEYQIGPCRGVDIGDHMTMARYVMYRVTEDHNCMVSFSPKPMDGDWNGAGCHTNFSVKAMRAEGGFEVIKKVCEAFGAKREEHIKEYGEGNDKRLTGKHETCSIKDFKFGVADRGASIRIPRAAEQSGKGYMEDRRPAANCDPYRVAARILLTTGECLGTEEAKEAAWSAPWDP